MPANIPDTDKARVIIIGGGFAGINLAHHLHNKDYQVVMLDKNNHHTFQPLLYQVATSGLEAGSIAYPLRKLLSTYKDFHFRMTEVLEVMSEEKCVRTSIGTIGYDYLVIATGSATNYFKMSDVEKNSLPLKSVAEAIDMRHHILQCFESALLVESEEEKQRMMNFMIAGAGPTGVELAGALSELRRHVLPKDYPELNVSNMRIVISDPGDRPINAMSKTSSKYAYEYLEKFGVELMFGVGVKSYDGTSVELSNGTLFPTATLIWAAGVAANPPKGIDPTLIARGNRILVDEFNRVLGQENIFAIGDVCQHETKENPRGLPMLAPVAIQQGKQLAQNLARISKGKTLEPFKYFDKGSLATVGRKKAVADLPKNLHLHGFFAWVTWLFVHLMYLVGFRNKMSVLSDWTWNYITFDRRVRLIVRPYNRIKSETKKLLNLTQEPSVVKTQDAVLNNPVENQSNKNT